MRGGGEEGEGRGRGGGKEGRERDNNNNNNNVYKLNITLPFYAGPYSFVLLHSVVVTTSPWPVPTVNNTGHVTDWFDSLAECLHWNVRKKQKQLS